MELSATCEGLSRRSRRPCRLFARTCRTCCARAAVTGLKPDTPITVSSDGTGTSQHTVTGTIGAEANYGPGFPEARFPEAWT